MAASWQYMLGCMRDLAYYVLYSGVRDRSTVTLPQRRHNRLGRYEMQLAGQTDFHHADRDIHGNVWQGSSVTFAGLMLREDQFDRLASLLDNLFLQIPSVVDFHKKSAFERLAAADTPFGALGGLEPANEFPPEGDPRNLHLWRDEQE